MTTKEIKIEEKQKSLKIYEQVYTGCNELLEKLNEYTNKVINVSFFEKYFTLSTDWGKTYTKYNIRKSEYSFGKPYKLYIGHFGGYGHSVDLDSRERLHIIECVQRERDNNAERIINLEEAIADLEEFDEEALRADLKNVFLKHNKPKIWDDILKDWDMSYYKLSEI